MRSRAVAVPVPLSPSKGSRDLESNDSSKTRAANFTKSRKIALLISILGLIAFLFCLQLLQPDRSKQLIPPLLQSFLEQAGKPGSSLGGLRIPRIIHQSWKTRDVLFYSYSDGNHQKYKEWIQSWTSLNPHWKYMFWYSS